MFLVISAIAAFLLWFFFVRRNTEYAIQISKLPGPKGNFIFGSMLDLWVPREDFHSAHCSLVKQTSDKLLSRIFVGRNATVSLLKAEAVENLLKSRINIDKSPGYDLLYPWLRQGLLTSTGAKWHSRRKLLTPSFHFSILSEFLAVFNEQCKKLLQKLEEHESKEECNIFNYVNLVSLDIICLTAMGKSVNALDNQNCEYVKALRDFAEIMVVRVYHPWLSRDWIFNLLPIGRRYQQNLKILHSFTKEVIQHRKQEKQFIKENEKTDALVNPTLGKKKRMAFLDVLLEEAESNHLDDTDIREEVDTFMFEGHDTTTMGLAWSIYCLGRHPEIQEKIHHEIDAIFGQDFVRPVSNDDLNNLKYLECCIKEAFRLFPPVPKFARRLSEDLQIGSHVIPKRCTVSVNAFLLHRDPDVFPNPEQFDPSRFFPENVTGRHPYAYLPFSAGPRNCIGQRFAMMEIKTCLCHLFRRYDIKALDPLDKMKQVAEFVLRPVGGIRVKLTRRAVI